MTKDSRGLDMSGGEDAVRAFDAAVMAYCGLRRDTGDHLKRALGADPAFAMGHVLRGYFMLLFAARSALSRAEASARAARAAMADALPRERAHLQTLERWVAGDLTGATQGWCAILGEWPRDLLAMKLAQHAAFYLGRSEAMRGATAPAAASLRGAPGYGFALGCHAFSLEECGEHEEAERLGRRAVELDPADIWAAHAVAHVAEMEDRAGDGLAFIAAHEGAWGEVNNFLFHVRWHRCLFLLARGAAEEALALYDREVRAEPTDDYLDIVNAVSLLWRLEGEEIDPGGRWDELAERARAHLNDHCLVFADLHYLIALAAVGDEAATAAWREAARAHAAAGGDDAARVLDAVGLALADAATAHRKRQWAQVVAAMLPVREKIALIGGSHAQRDLFDEMLIDAALRADPPLASTLLAERLARRPRNPWGRAAEARLGRRA